jgi:hypothetical protein
MITLALGLFVALAYEKPLAATAIPLFMGLGFLCDYRLRLRDLKARNTAPQN